MLILGLFNYSPILLTVFSEKYWFYYQVIFVRLKLCKECMRKYHC